MNKFDKIYVAGHRGLVGSAIIRKLEKEGYGNIITRTHKELDLTRQKDVEDFLNENKPEYVFLAAARVRGILANSTYKADFIYDNVMIASNVIYASYKYGVKKLLNLGSSCIFPKHAHQPMKEEYLLTGPLEPTNEPYAIAKITAIKMCRYFNEQYGTNFISVMPANLYGPNDNFDLETSHVLPALIRKIHEAKINNKPGVEIWGTGKPRREFLYVDDLADACVYLMNKYDYKDIGEFVNIGTGKDVTIQELALIISKIVGYRGKIEYNPSMPDGTPQKLHDVSQLNALGWKYKTELENGIVRTYRCFLESIAS